MDSLTPGEEKITETFYLTTPIGIDKIGVRANESLLGIEMNKSGLNVESYFIPRAPNKSLLGIPRIRVGESFES
jgi:hypothetical protein